MCALVFFTLFTLPILLIGVSFIGMAREQELEHIKYMAKLEVERLRIEREQEKDEDLS